MTKHALFSASAAERWVNCPGSIALAFDAPKSAGSFAANEGTACHEIGERCLRDMTDQTDPYDYVGEVIRVEDMDIDFTDDLAELVTVYVEYVRGLPGIRLTEVRCNYAKILGLDDDEAFGTSDTVLLDGTTLHIIDAKFGRGYVNPEKNKQLTLYAGGAVDALEFLGETVDQIVLHIVQPRVTTIPQSFTLTRAELTAAIANVKRAVAEAQQAVVLYDPSNPRTILRFLHAGETQCHWCPAKAGCPELRRIAASVDVAQPVADLTGMQLSEDMDRLEVLEQWIAAIRTEVIRRCTAGQKVAGWKMVLGREGNRKWRDTEAAEEAVADVDPELTHEPAKLKSPAQLEKVVKKHKLDVDINALVVRNPAKPTLTTEDDPRERWVENDIVDEFGDLT